ncbi:MAG: hypothetical protein NUV54_01135 [Candidatus Taylorbacteria bacterium]|nr:hypothetical protein [Candidatus Taylorbacteria bacterium]
MAAVKILTLRSLSKDRLREARILFASDKLHGAKYLCGYAVEHAIKYRICRYLGWNSYPPPNPKSNTNDATWESLASLKTHDLQILLLFTGSFERIFNDAILAAAWDDVKNWDSEIRYEAIKTQAAERTKLKTFLDSAAIIMRCLGCPTS